MHFPLFQISPISKKFLPVENFPNFIFSHKNVRFSSAKISDDLFSHSLKDFEFTLIFLPFQVHFPPYFEKKILFPPYFFKFPSDFVKFTCFLHTLWVFVSPQFDHDAFLHHTMHVLDAPASSYAKHLSHHTFNLTKAATQRMKYQSTLLGNTGIKLSSYVLPARVFHYSTATPTPTHHIDNHRVAKFNSVRLDDNMNVTKQL